MSKLVETSEEGVFNLVDRGKKIGTIIETVIRGETIEHLYRGWAEDDRETTIDQVEGSPFEDKQIAIDMVEKAYYERNPRNEESSESKEHIKEKFEALAELAAKKNIIKTNYFGSLTFACYEGAKSNLPMTDSDPCFEEEISLFRFSNELFPLEEPVEFHFTDKNCYVSTWYKGSIEQNNSITHDDTPDHPFVLSWERFISKQGLAGYGYDGSCNFEEMDLETGFELLKKWFEWIEKFSVQ